VPADPYFDRLVGVLTSLALEQPAPIPELADTLAAMAAAPAEYALPDVHVTSDTVPGPHGDIPVRVYRSALSGQSAPMLVWCHGGGWVGGDLDMPEADATAREICFRTGAAVISVDYRLATGGVHYPVPLDDVVAAFHWAVVEAEALGADPTRISLGGASAGANLAAGAALRLRDEGGPAPSASLLIYPCVHPLLPPPSDELAAKLAGLTPLMAFAPEVLTPTVENYLGAPVDAATPYAMAALGALSGLPPTLIINCEYDGLRASGEAYALALKDAGVRVEIGCAPGVLHGHLNHPWLPSAQSSLATMAEWVLRAGVPG
jgi:acetyl esterase/lipase